MGNAAHFLHPVAGQGFNLALRDCAALTKILTQADKAGTAIGKLSVLQQYTQAQTADQRLTIGLSDGVTKLFSTSKLPPVILRSLGLLALELLPATKKLLVRQTVQKRRGDGGFGLSW